MASGPQVRRSGGRWAKVRRAGRAGTAVVGIMLAVLLGGCGIGVTVHNSAAPPPLTRTAAADFTDRPFCGLRPGSYGSPAANAYADALVEENRRFAVFEQMSADTGTDVDQVKDLLRLQREQMATFIGEIAALPVTVDQKPLVD